MSCGGGEFILPSPHLPRKGLAVKLKNKSNGIYAEVSEALGNTLVAAGGWEEISDEKPRRTRKTEPVEE